MPQRKKTIPTPEGPKEAVVVDVVSSRETYNVYTLEDGSRLKLKAVMIEVLRVEGDYDDEGNPLYVAKSRNILAVDAPDRLKRPT